MIIAFQPLLKERNSHEAGKRHAFDALAVALIKDEMLERSDVERILKESEARA